MEVALTKANVLESSEARDSITLRSKGREKLPNPPPAFKSSSINYFKCLGKGHIALQCPNKRNIILLEDRTMDNDSSKFMREDHSSQRENIFHSHYHVTSQIYSIIIDGGSSVNIASTRLVEKLKLPTLTQPKSYKL
ncbi:hypothetical protein CR513_41300, partial [Mucuna pruriens]